MAPLLATAAAAPAGGVGATASRSIPVMLGRATSRRLMRAPPSSTTAAAAAAMRETAALQLEERHYDWGYSKPVVALDLVWNLAFVLVSASVLLSTARERPSTPIRAWIFGYAVQCLLHVGFVCFEYRRRRRRRTWRRMRWVGTREEEEDGLEDSPESRFCC